MQPLRITARPVAGIACDGYLPLDGILAYAARVRRLGMAAMALCQDEPVEDEPLPLERRGNGDDWYWAASCVECRWLSRDMTHWNKRLDIVDAGQWVAGDWKPVYTGGQYKAWHQPVFMLLTPLLTWYAVGDRDAVADLLAGVYSIGKKTAMGYGALVDGFAVEPWPEDVSCTRDGHAMRALPLADAPATVDHLAEYGIRAPYWHPAQRRLCAMPRLQLP